MSILKKVLILGASSDIGIEVIKEYLLKNYQVYAHFNKSKIFIKSRNLYLLKSDFEKDKHYIAFINKIKKINFACFVNLIGFVDNKTLEQSNSKNILKSFKINFIYPVLISNLLSKIMMKNHFGRILHCSSIGVKFGGGDNTYTYSLSKHLLEFIPSYYKKIIKHNVFYNVLRVGVTNTKIHTKIKNKNLKNRIKQIPAQRMASANEIAKYIYFINSEKNTYVANQLITISGGE
jgi:short-subunit dehydrogenase